MENRFENLYGYIQRSLVKNIRKELGDDESLTIGILLFKSYSESFYYESTVKNTLLFPWEIKKIFTEREIWNMELLFYLGRYFSLHKGYIHDLIKDNNKLDKYNASFYAIAFNEYEKFKIEWLGWLNNLNSDIFHENYNSKNEGSKIILNQLFYFSNYLLTIIRYNAYREGFNPNTGSFREHMYRVVLNNIVDSNSGPVALKTGELPPNSTGVNWYRKADSQIKYSELALVLEICFKQPFSNKDKINDLKAIIEYPESASEKYQLSAMAKPLLYNGEFQGIIYITRNMNKGNFEYRDFDKFKKAISDFHIESIIYSSRYDTARILLEKITASDQLQIHPLIKVLNAQHIFSSSPMGIIIIPDVSCYVRYRDDKVMQTKISKVNSEKIFELFIKELDVNINELMIQTNYYWFDIPVEHETKFNRKLTETFDVTEELFVNSVTCMKFHENDNPIYYFMFNSNHIELLKVEINDAIKQSYALRTHNEVNKLIDAYQSSKNLSDIQNNLLNEIQLGIIHEQKSFLNSKIVDQITEIEKITTKKKIKEITKRIKSDTANAIERFGDYVKVLSEQSNELDQSIISIKEITEIFDKVKAKHKYKDIKIICDFSKLMSADTIQSYLYSISYIIDQLVSNAIRQYNSPEGQLINNKSIELRVKSSGSSNDSLGFIFEVFNTGTNIPESIRKIAGLERIANGSNNSTGYGFLLINNLLKRIKPPLADGNQYFEINNKTEGVEIRFSIYNKHARR